MRTCLKKKINFITIKKKKKQQQKFHCKVNYLPHFCYSFLKKIKPQDNYVLYLTRIEVIMFNVKCTNFKLFARRYKMND